MFCRLVKVFLVDWFLVLAVTVGHGGVARVGTNSVCPPYPIRLKIRGNMGLGRCLRPIG